MRMPVVSGFAKNIPARRALATAAATVVLGVAMPVLSGGAPAWACGDQPAKVAAPTPAPGQAAAHGIVTSAFTADTPDSITAGGSAIEVGVEVGNFTGVAYDGITPQLAFDNTRASGSGVGSNVRPQDFTVQVMVDGGWRTLPMLHGCDPVIHADTSSLAQRLENGRSARFLFRVSLSANAPADQRTITMYTGQDAQGKVPSHNLEVVHAGGTPTPGNPGEDNGFTAGLFMMGTKPLDITPGGAPLEIGIESGKQSGAPYQDVRPELVLSSHNSWPSVSPSDVVLEQGTAGGGWKPVPMRPTGHYTVTADLSGEQGSPVTNGHATHFTYRLALKPGVAKDLTKLWVTVSAVAEDGRASAGQERLIDVLHPAAANSTPAVAAKQSAAPNAAGQGADAAAPVAATGPAAAPTTEPSDTATASTSTSDQHLAYTGGGDGSWGLAAAGSALLASGAAAVFFARRRGARG